jgi:hypothetical protein
MQWEFSSSDDRTDMLFQFWEFWKCSGMAKGIQPLNQCKDNPGRTWQERP